jgi:type IV pilus assembly protein PilQ
MKCPSLVLCATFLAATAANAGAAGPISLDVRDLDIYDAVRLLSTQSSINVVVDSSVPHHPVTLRLHDVTFDEALATFAQANDLQSARVGNVVYLGTSDAVNRRYPSGDRHTSRFVVRNASPGDVTQELTDVLPKGTVIVADRRTSSVLVTGTMVAIEHARDLIDVLDRSAVARTTAIAMRYVKSSEALKALEATIPISAPSSAYASDQQNQIVLSGSNDFIAQAGSLIAAVDRPGRQVRYEVRVTDLEPTENSNVGFIFGGADINGQQQAGSGSTVTTFLQNSLLVNATINALVSKGEARVLARPSISSLNNVQASLLVGQQYPIVYFDARTGTQQVQFVNVGVNLTVTPTIGTDGAITTDLETDYSQVTGLVQSFPIITTRKAQSTLRVRDGETIVIAGLFSDVDSRTLTKVPFLADIPFIGEIFKDRQHDHNRDEVVFLITPHLVIDGDPANGVSPIERRTPKH